MVESTTEELSKVEVIGVEERFEERRAAEEKLIVAVSVNFESLIKTRKRRMNE